MKNTKNEFKKKIKQMPFSELMKLYNDLNIQIMQGRYKISRGDNPYDKGEHPIKILKWKKGLVNQELLKKSS